jgi:hypothetical protein
MQAVGSFWLLDGFFISPRPTRSLAKLSQSHSYAGKTPVQMEIYTPLANSDACG